MNGNNNRISNSFFNKSSYEINTSTSKISSSGDILILSEPNIKALVKCGIELKNQIATGLDALPNHIIHERLNEVAEDIYNIVKDQNKNDIRPVLSKYRNEIIRLCIDQKACHSVNIQDITNFIKICTLLPHFSDYKPPTKWFHLCCKDLDLRLKELISNESNITETITEKTNLTTYLQDIYNVNQRNYEVWSKVDDADLTNARLKISDGKYHFNFYDCNFTNVKFEKQAYIKADINRSNMTNCSFVDTIIEHTNFDICRLSNNNFTNSEIRDSKLQSYSSIVSTEQNKAIFRGAKFRYTTINGTWSHADFSDVTFVTCIFRDAVCNDADFSRAKFTYRSNIGHGDFSKANFNSAQLIGVSLCGSKLADATFEDVAEFTLYISDNLDLEFNHINNPSGSILTAINSIDSKYNGLKNRLMIQVFQFLKYSDINSIMEALVDILFNKYNKQSYAQALITVPVFANNLFRSRKKQGNNKILPMSAQEIDFHLDFIQWRDIYNKSNFLDTVIDENGYNGFFIQLIHQAKKTANLKENADKFYKDYLETIGFFTAQTEEGELMTSVIDAIYGTEEAIYNPEIMLFVSNQDIIIVKSDYYNQALSEKNPSSFNWENITYFQCTKIKSPENPNAIIYKNIRVTNLDDIAAFRIFLDKFQFQRKKNTFKNLIETLNLGEYKKSFLEAILTPHSATKYIEFTHQKKLADILQNLFGDAKDILGIKVDTLKISHIDEILQIYGFGKKSAKEQAQLLLLLSGIFIKYGSSLIFGTEENSPYPLRRYAAGLLAAAVQKDKNIAPAAQLQDWINRMLGLGGAFTCVAVLSDNIIKYCQEFLKYTMSLKGIIPSAWI